MDEHRRVPLYGGLTLLWFIKSLRTPSPLASCFVLPPASMQSSASKSIYLTSSLSLTLAYELMATPIHLPTGMVVTFDGIRSSNLIDQRQFKIIVKIWQSHLFAKRALY